MLIINRLWSLSLILLIFESSDPTLLNTPYFSYKDQSVNYVYVNNRLFRTSYEADKMRTLCVKKSLCKNSCVLLGVK